MPGADARDDSTTDGKRKEGFKVEKTSSSRGRITRALLV